MILTPSQRVPDALVRIVNLELQAHKIKATALFPVDGPQVLTICVKTAFGGRIEQVEALRATLAEKTGSGSARIDLTRDGLLVQLPKQRKDCRTVTRAELLARVKREGRPIADTMAPLGLDVLNRVTWLDIADATTPHVAVFGITGSGKTTLLSWLAWWLAMHGRPRLLVATPKADDFSGFDGLAGLLHPVVRTADELARLMAWTMQEAAQRRLAGIGDRLVLVIDEVPYWREHVPGFDGNLAELAAIGRGLGLHLLVGSQEATERAVGRAVFNLPARIVGRIGSNVHSYVTAGKAGANVDALQGLGDFLQVTPHLVRFQSPLLAPADMPLAPAGDNVLELPFLADGYTRADAGNSWNAAPVDMEALAEAVEAGAGVRQIMADFGIGYTRAKRYMEELS